MAPFFQMVSQFLETPGEAQASLSQKLLLNYNLITKLITFYRKVTSWKIVLYVKLSF